jgi:flagellar biosynthesis/type III secretory pathway protein FliH
MGRVLKAFAQPAPAPAPEPRVAPEETAAVLEAARRDGYADGIAQLAALLNETQSALQAVPRTAIKLARKMAEKIIGRAVQLDEETSVDLVVEAVTGWRPEFGPVRLRVHPDDLPALQARRERLEAHIPAAALELVADEAVGRYGCVIDSPRGQIDARLETQLAALERAARGEDPDA